MIHPLTAGCGSATGDGCPTTSHPVTAGCGFLEVKHFYTDDYWHQQLQNPEHRA
jgi:hypothetical protein